MALLFRNDEKKLECCNVHSHVAGCSCRYRKEYGMPGNFQVLCQLTSVNILRFHRTRCSICPHYAANDFYPPAARRSWQRNLIIGRHVFE